MNIGILCHSARIAQLVEERVRYVESRKELFSSKPLKDIKSLKCVWLVVYIGGNGSFMDWGEWYETRMSARIAVKFKSFPHQYRVIRALIGKGTLLRKRLVRKIERTKSK